ncbi:MAG: CinA family protein [Acidimicrobiaceae bacterium]|nr:CinA family protein [Acidimicrobiaceae bacterium]
MEDQNSSRVIALADRLKARDWRIAVAESLTGGQLAVYICQGPQASGWFNGGIVAYQPAIKRKLLGVSDGPVVSERCALEMARGVSELLEAEIGVALTGVGGPEPSDGHEAGTVWIAVHTPHNDLSRLAYLNGHPPGEVCDISCAIAIDLATEVLSSEPD